MATTQQGGAQFRREGGLDRGHNLRDRRPNLRDRRRGHGWWPYLVPYMGFMLMVELSARFPASLAPWFVFLVPGVPAILLIRFWRGGAYPELRGYRADSGLVLDVLLGVALAGMWIAPFVLFPSMLPFDWMRPDTSVGFDPQVLGASMVPLALTVRMLGYGVVTPYFEELFMRSFVMRYAEVVDGSRDFRDLPIGQFAWTGFLTTLVLFTITHQPWEYGVMFLWALVTNLWLYYRKHLLAVIISHGVTNASILAFVIQYDGRFLDFEGSPMSLWFFV